MFCLSHHDNAMESPPYIYIHTTHQNRDVSKGCDKDGSREFHEFSELQQNLGSCVISWKEQFTTFLKFSMG